MSEEKTIRIDKFLWSVRVFKTRSMASEACRKGRILINDVPAKPSRIIIGNEIVMVRKPPVTFSYRVIEPIENRISAKLVNKYIEDITPEEEKEKLIIKTSAGIIYRQKGSGRPTKRDRRVIDRINDGFNDT